MAQNKQGKSIIDKNISMYFISSNTVALYNKRYNHKV